jgi:hypothetical protein
MTDDKAVQNVLCCKALAWPTTGFTPNSNYPNVTADSFRDWLLRYLIDGTLPPGTRAFCGVAIPSFPLSSGS